MHLHPVCWRLVLALQHDRSCQFLNGSWIGCGNGVNDGRGSTIMGENTNCNDRERGINIGPVRIHVRWEHYRWLLRPTMRLGGCKYYDNFIFIWRFVLTRYDVPIKYGNCEALERQYKKHSQFLKRKKNRSWEVYKWGALIQRLEGVILMCHLLPLLVTTIIFVTNWAHLTF
jgi:hypothetical protein